MRCWLRRFLWLAGFGCLWINVFDDPPLRTGAYVQGVGQTAATVAMITAAPTGVECTVTGRGGEPVRLISDSPQRRHVFYVDGLEPGRTYDYELRTSDGQRDGGVIRTAPAGDDAAVRFAFLGDSGDQPWWVWLQRTPILHLPARWDWLPTSAAVTGIGAAVAAYEPDFAVHLGDVIYPSGRHAHYRSGFFRPFADLIRSTPFYAVLGNHDVMAHAGQPLLSNLPGSRSSVAGDSRCFSFARGAVRVIGLDCNTHLVGDHYQPDHPSHRFLAAELARCSEPWIVVASHFPILSASRQRNRGDLMKSLLPELDRYQVSLYLSGHDHCYQHFRAGADGATPLVVSGGGGKKLYDVRPDPKAIVIASEHHWCSAEAAGRAMTVVAHALGGGDLDRFVLRAPAGKLLERLREINPGRAARIDALPD